MNYLELIRYFWKLDNAWQFTCCETRLYFYLVETANSLGWVNNWTHSDAKAAANVGVSVNTLKTARNRLSQAGLIAFKEGGKGHANKTRYQILTPNLQPKVIPKVTPNLQPKVEPLLNKHKLNKTKQTNIPPTPPEGDVEKKISDIEKREAALNKLEEELKERERAAASSKKSKITDPLNKEARSVFEKHYSETFGSEYYWTAKDAGNMSSMLKKLKYQREQKNLPVSDEGILYALKFFLESIQEGWIFENFSVTNINSKFNEIIAQAKIKANGKTGTNAGIGEYRPGNGNITPRTDAERKKAERDHLGGLADAILQQPAAKNSE